MAKSPGNELEKKRRKHLFSKFLENFWNELRNASRFRQFHKDAILNLIEKSNGQMVDKMFFIPELFRLVRGPDAKRRIIFNGGVSESRLFGGFIVIGFDVASVDELRVMRRHFADQA